MSDDVTDVALVGEGKREQNKASKRRRILEAASELFSEQGFEATTTAAIAKRAGIGAGTLYRYVDSKEDLLMEMFRQQVDPVWEQAFAQVDGESVVLDQLLSVFNHVAEYHRHDENLTRAFFKHLRFVSRPMVDDAERSSHRHVDLLTTLLQQGQADDRLDAGVSAADLADNLYSIWLTLMSRHYAGRRTWDQYLASLERSFRTCLFRLVPLA